MNPCVFEVNGLSFDYKTLQQINIYKMNLCVFEANGFSFGYKTLQQKISIK